MNKNTQIIAEVKTRSPFGYESERSWEYLLMIARRVGDIISIHTDPRWGGDFQLITDAKVFTRKPILAKGIHETDEQINEAVKRGADHVLVVGRIPKVHLDKCLIEVKSLQQLEEFSQILGPNAKFVWNSRDLDTGGLNNETWEQARGIWQGWMCQASNIQTIDDIQDSANAVLVGTHLEQFNKSIIQQQGIK